MSASDIIKQRIAALRAAKEQAASAAQQGVTNDTVRDERKDVPAESGEQPSVSSGIVTGTSSESSQSVEPSRELDVQHGSVHAVVLPTEIQSTKVIAIPEDESASSDSGSSEEVESTGLDRTNPIHFEFLSKLQSLEGALLTRDPQMKTHLAAIHRTMIQYDDIPNLLRPQEIAKIMAAQQVHTNMTLAQSAAKKSTSKKSVTQNLTLDDV